MRTALRTSSNRAAVRMLQQVGIPETVQLRAAARRRVGAERAVAGARLRRSDPALDDGGVRDVREQAACVPHADRHPPQSRRPMARCCTTAAARAARGQRSHRVPDDHDDGRRRSTRAPHGRRGALGSRCQPRERPERRTTTTTRGSSATRRSWSPASGSATTSRARSSRTAMPASSRCRSGAGS